tara:strand:- start:410 stop:568 length:159 start_codon:yes stop_codon:yes gene_type:complete
MFGHDIEEGHDCPKCGVNSICTIEDGDCENQGLCDDCIKAEVYERMDREDYS